MAIAVDFFLMRARADSKAANVRRRGHAIHKV